MVVVINWRHVSIHIPRTSLYPCRRILYIFQLHAHILKEDYLPKLLDNPTNRRLLNVIAKNNDLSNIRYNKSNPFLRQMGPVKRFIKDTLYIVDPMKIGELLWVIFLNGDIDYLKDPLIISTDFQVYEIYYYM